MASSATETSTESNAFDSIKQVDAGLLNVGYIEAGPADGPAVVLLHGWPYDIHSYVDVAPLLTPQGSMAERAGATIIEVDGSHVIMVSQPAAVAEVILTAAAAVDRLLPAATGG